MAKSRRLSQIAREFNIGHITIVEFLEKAGHKVESRPNALINPVCYDLLVNEFSSDKSAKKESRIIRRRKTPVKETVSLVEPKNEVVTKKVTEDKVVQNEKKVVAPKIVGKIDLSNSKQKKETTKEVLESKVKLVEEKTPEKKPEKTVSTTPEVTLQNENKKSTPENIEKKEVSIKKEAEPINKPEKKDTAKTDTPITTKEDEKVKILGKIDLESINQKTRPGKLKSKKEKIQDRQEREKASKLAIDKARLDRQQKQEERSLLKNKQKTEELKKQAENSKPEFIETKVKQLTGPTVVGKIFLKENDSVSDRKKKRKKRKRKRIVKPVDPKAAQKENADKSHTRYPRKANPSHKAGTGSRNKRGFKRRTPVVKTEVTNEDIKNQVKATLAKLTEKKKKTGVRHRKDKRLEAKEKIERELQATLDEEKILKVTEFISASELASHMDIPVNKVIQTCFELGKMVQINQRLDAEIISVVAEEYGFKVDFVTISQHEAILEIEDAEEDLVPRAPIVTIMGHVDHGKTSLLDYIRHANVIAGEAGGITQHIGAYNVTLADGRRITFLDTPGHEAFTAMRARGAKVTDIAIIVVSADDNIMPQTKEAISHAQAADVPIVFAINKIDKEGANPEFIKKELASMNLLVEEWGGKFQSKDISAKFGTNVDDLLEEVMLAAEMLELKANPNRVAKGSIIESSLDRGRGYVTTVLVETGTLKVGDVILAGPTSGKVKAMFNERDQRIKSAGPSEPVLVLGLNGAPQAGVTLNVVGSEKEAREYAAKYERIQREQSMRAHKHITLDEIGRRLKVGNFQQLNVIIKGDVDGSVEALSDSLIKLSTEEIEVNVIHKAVGQISEADVMLAAASDAIIIGFQVRPAIAAKRIAEKEQIDIRLYHVIYDAIEELKDAMTGMLSPEIKEEITGNVEIREVFQISKSGKVAGCYVLDGKITRDSKIRIIRDGIVTYNGVLGSLRRFKDNVKEVTHGFECGLNVDKFNDIKVGDIVEAYKEVEVARTL